MMNLHQMITLNKSIVGLTASAALVQLKNRIGAELQAISAGLKPRIMVPRWGTIIYVR